MKKAEVLARIRAEKVVAIVRADGPGRLLGCAQALALGGLNAVELTLTTPGVLGAFAAIAAELPRCLLGLGTVLDAEAARAGIAAGARFLVTPGLRPTVVAAGREAGVPVICGALTPTEVLQAWELGADVVKIFPAEFFGPAYIKALKGGPLPQVEMMPTGGVTPETVGDFLRAGAFAASAGSALIAAAALQAGDWPAITARARQFAAAAQAA